MTTYSVADAKNRLSKLIDSALRGEGVVVTSHGTPVVEIRAIRPAPRAITEADIEWLRSRRVGTTMPSEDAGAFISRMRDEDWP